ncbi:hypothetical protein GLYMA_18G181150v4 [Glycine max]|nr:hypothetical protein GLYMA_18G181150v4 [Glycine max]KAH1155016.1 hypothetical protein GYH30_050351 [Glycine max]
MLLSVKYVFVLLGILIQFHSQLLQLQSFIPKLYTSLLKAFKKNLQQKKFFYFLKKVHLLCSLNSLYPTCLIKSLSVKCLL